MSGLETKTEVVLNHINGVSKLRTQSLGTLPTDLFNCLHHHAHELMNGPKH